MPRLTADFKEQIKSLSQKDLHQIVTKLAAKEQFVFDFVKINYIDKDFGEQELFEQAKSDLKGLRYKNYVGRAEELRLAKLLAASIKRVNEFTKLSKNKVLEAELLMYVLEIPFPANAKLLGTCFTAYDSKVASIVKRLINLVTKKLHEDYKLDYQNSINEYLTILHKKSRHINAVYDMPKSI